MKRTLLGVILALLVMAGAYGIAGAADPPHTDYEPAYSGSGCDDAACHTITANQFLPQSLDQNSPYAPAMSDFTNFCLSCHNAAGEAHDRSAGAPSTNVYVNGTGFNLSTSYSGTSHSWNGLIHNAGTRVPTSAGFVYTGYSGTSYMPGDKVRCQTCHEAMYKTQAQNINWTQATASDSTHYTISGYASTSQYLAKYIRVYAVNFTTEPTNVRTKKQYLVDPSQYTYDYSTATITFSQAPATSYIFVDIPEPYLRVGNTANVICLDCHNNRTNPVRHPYSAGAKSDHPVVVNYGYGYGLHTTLLAAPNPDIYLEGGQVLCTSCHKPHNAPGNNGELTRNADASAMCADCHKTKFAGYSTAGSVNYHNGKKHSKPTVCLDCHTTHNSNNIMLIRNKINGVAINFQLFSGIPSFANGSGFSLCEVCHSGLGHHNAGVVDTTKHHNDDRCTKCHTHASGFQPIGGACDSCHGFPPPPAPSGWASSAGDMHVSHISILAAAPFNLTGNLACAQCHGPQIPTATHDTGKTEAFIDATTAVWGWNGAINPYTGHNYGTPSFSDGGTNGITNTLDDTCTNVSCHNAASTRTWRQPTGCNGCHGFPPTDGSHFVQYTTGIRAHLPSAGAAIYKEITAYGQAGWPCGKCHNNPRSDHQDGRVEVNAGGGYGACGGDFTINVITTGSNVTCSNAVCHTANKTTPNWY